MDWTTFFKDNPVIAGALIATIPILISNLVQIYLRISENRWKQKETKIQAKEKWIERDILETMGLIERIMKLSLQVTLPDESKEGLLIEVYLLMGRIGTLLHSLYDSEIINKGAEFINAITPFARSKGKTADYMILAQKGGELHKALRDKLISIRDT